MSSVILQRSLESLHTQFSQLRDDGVLSVTLVESPCFTREPRKISTFGLVPTPESVEWWCEVYRKPLVQIDAAGKDIETETPYVDEMGNRQLSSTGRPLDFLDCGVLRYVNVNGDRELWDRFKQYFADAGNLLESIPSQLKSRFPSESIAIRDPNLRWICALFDLAWAQIPGLPLRPKPGRSVLVQIDPNLLSPNTPPGDSPCTIAEETGGDHAGTERQGLLPYYQDVPLSDWPQFKREFSCPEALKHSGDPPEWYSKLADIVQASMYGIQVLLSDLAELRGGNDDTKASSAGQPLEPAVEITLDGDDARPPTRRGGRPSKWDGLRQVMDEMSTALSDKSIADAYNRRFGSAIGQGRKAKATAKIVRNVRYECQHPNRKRKQDHG